MLTDKTIAKQARRLFRLPFAAGDAEARALDMQELTRVLRKCRSETHLEAVVTHLMTNCQRFPPPCEVLEAVAMVADPSARPKASAGCEYCFGDGWEASRFELWTRTPHGMEKQQISKEQFDDLASKVDWFRQAVYAFARPCRCRRAA